MKPDNTIISDVNKDSFLNDTATWCKQNTKKSDTKIVKEIQKLAQKYRQYLS